MRGNNAADAEIRLLANGIYKIFLEKDPDIVKNVKSSESCDGIGDQLLLTTH